MTPPSASYFDYFATCQCPKAWSGIIPPPCPVHNPSTMWTTTNTYPAYQVSYKCPTCRKRYLRPTTGHVCAVLHPAGDCCHVGEQRVDKKGRPK